MTTNMHAPHEAIESLFADTSDMSDVEVAQYLKRAGIDVDAGQRRFDRVLEELMAADLVAAHLSDARRPTPALLQRLEGMVRAMARTKDELISLLQGHQVVVAHRDLRTLTQEDLETQYAEALAIEAAARGETE